MSAELMARLLATKKHYDDLAAQPLPYRPGVIIQVGDVPWKGTVGNIPVTIDPGTQLEVQQIGSTTDVDFSPAETLILQIPNSVIRMLGLDSDTIEVEPGETIRVRGAQLRNAQMNAPMIREAAEEHAPRFTPKQHRLASRLIDQLNDAAMDIAIDRVKRDDHFLTPEEANVLFRVLFDEMGMGKHFDTLEDLRAAHSEFLDILMRAREAKLRGDR